MGLGSNNHLEKQLRIRSDIIKVVDFDIEILIGRLIFIDIDID